MSETQPAHYKFLSADSPEGRKKQHFLETQRIICAHVPNAEPSYRLTWERMNQAVAEIQECILKELREAENGEDLARQYIEVPGKQPVISVFLNTIQQMLAASVQGYDVRFGFDMDALLHVEIAPDKVPTFCCEIFPRMQEGKASIAFASEIGFAVPLIRVQIDTTPGSGSDESYSNLERFIFDGEPWGGDLSPHNRVLRSFFLGKGIWPIRKRTVVAEFILYAALSCVEYGMEGQRKLLVPVGWTDEEQLQRHAEIHTGRTKRHLTLVR